MYYFSALQPWWEVQPATLSPPPSPPPLPRFADDARFTGPGEGGRAGRRGCLAAGVPGVLPPPAVLPGLPELQRGAAGRAGRAAVVPAVREVRLRVPHAERLPPARRRGGGLRGKPLPPRAFRACLSVGGWIGAS